MRNSKFKLLLLSFFITANAYAIDKAEFVENPTIILVDIGGTLINFDYFSLGFNYLGIVDSLRCLFVPNGAKNFYLDTLTQIQSPVKTDYNVKWFEGKSMPELIRDSMAGKISNEECLKIAHEWADKNKDKFSKPSHRELFKKIINLHFTAEVLIKYQQYTSIMGLTQKLYEACDEKTGKRKNIIIILSNQAKEMIEPLKKLFPKIFDYSDEQVFSCYEGFVKPDEKLFEKCLSLCPKTCNKTCYFIDDEKVNIETSKTYNTLGYTIVGLYPNQAKKELKVNGLIV